MVYAVYLSLSSSNCIKMPRCFDLQNHVWALLPVNPDLIQKRVRDCSVKILRHQRTISDLPGTTNVPRTPVLRSLPFNSLKGTVL